MDKFKPYIFPIIIGVFSLISITDNLDLSNIPKLVISIIGILSVALYFLKNDKAALLIKIWIISQIPQIYSESEIIENGATYLFTNNYWETSQIFDISFGLTLDALSIKINIIPFFFLGFYRLLKASNFIGKQLDINAGLKRENKLGNVFPMNGKIIDTIKFDDKSIWMVTQLDSPLKFNGIDYRHILLFPKENDVFKINKRQLGFLRLINPEKKMDSLTNLKNEYPFIDYVGVKVNKTSG